MAIPLEITVSDHQAASVVALAGELDIATGDVLRGAIRDLIQRGRVRLVVDASVLQFCDSYGLEALLEMHDTLREAGGSMCLAGVHGVLRLVLDVTGTETLKIRPTPAEALADVLVAPVRDVTMSERRERPALSGLA
ncbi:MULTISPECIES: STAS domain-containing protein [Sphaerimonospora]|uniref:Anti-sigma factor antagonist n=2 Tax=Sphaerimonospora TaxID=1792303 RepID=A0A8J3W1I3_9ACTN|nr:STAS domain-containing protein [Sphaerimonospora thailandensis]GIH71806.1 anti-sigma factor antagonist [Sphaerimonospora thailandensis]